MTSEFTISPGTQIDVVHPNARFLLLPWVQVKNLASHALARRQRQLADDWQREHGVRPVLVETYVNERRHKGTCYRASNWRYLGQTQARGAQGGVPAKTPKAVYVYPLQRDWRAVLLGQTRPPRPPPGVAPPLNSARRPLCESTCLPRLPHRSDLGSLDRPPTSHLHVDSTRISSRPHY